MNQMKDDVQLRVLMVDDSQDQYVLVRDMLSAVGHEQTEVEWAATYYEGLSCVEVNDYDVCLIDYDLGHNNGLNFISNVKKMRPFLPLILLTGHGSREVDLKAMEAGAVDYLDKSQLRPNTLERSIRYATENLRVIQSERKQRALAEALLDTAMALNSTLDFESVLERLLSNVGKVIRHDMANIMLIEDCTAYIVKQHGYDAHGLAQFIDGVQLDIKKTMTLRHMAETQSPLLIQDVRDFDDWLAYDEQSDVRSYLGSPIFVEGEIIGFINLDAFEENFFNQEQARYLQVFANQAAQAIRNSRAYDQAQALAAGEERQRLARDLHDAVTQTLFSASMTAETLARIYHTQPERIEDGLNDLVQLSRAALAEMRTMLVELRPQALLEQDLPRLLQNLVNAKKSRLAPDVQFVNRLDVSLPEDVHIAVYRIAQESLNNVEKYAQAEHVLVSLSGDASRIDLRVHDDGVGFNPASVPPGHFGLKIMRERAAAIGATLTITSAAHEGTEVHLAWRISE